jgi:hypothetical protein
MKRPSLYKEYIALGASAVILITGIVLAACGIPIAGVPLILTGAIGIGISHAEITCRGGGSGRRRTMISVF